ncbi:MAG: ABC-2 transporter permease [Methanocorpusculum parvum]|nr:ABC-2 transporter permease [Methanocorpusculum parvum]
MKYANLLYSDFLTHKHRILALLAGLVFLMVCFGVSGVYIVAFLGIICFAPKVVELVAGGNVSENFEGFLLTTRFSRKDVVRARYLLFAVSFAVTILIGTALCLFFEGFRPLLIPSIAFSIIYGSVSIPVCCLLDFGMSKPAKIGLTILGFIQMGVLFGSIALFVTGKAALLPSGFGILAVSILCCAASYLVSQRIYAKKEF